MDREIRAFADGEMTFCRAAERTGVDVWTFAERVRESECLWVDEERLREDLDAV